MTSRLTIGPKDVSQAVETIRVIGDAIRDIGSVPSGELYAMLCGKMSLETYTRIIEILKEAQQISETGFLLTWIGPARKEVA